MSAWSHSQYNPDGWCSWFDIAWCKMGKNLFFVLETEENEQAHAISESKLKLLQMCISVHLLHLLILQEAFFHLPNRSFYANTSFKMCCSNLVTGDKTGQMPHKFSCNQKRLHHELSEAPLCFLDRPGVFGRWRGAGNWFVCTPWQRRRVCMLKKSFFGEKERSEVTAALFPRPFGTALIRQHKPAQSTGGRCICLWYGVAPCPTPTPPLLTRKPPPTNITSIASGNKPSLFQLLTNHVLTSRASTL